MCQYKSTSDVVLRLHIGIFVRGYAQSFTLFTNFAIAKNVVSPGERTFSTSFFDSTFQSKVWVVILHELW